MEGSQKLKNGYVTLTAPHLGFYHPLVKTCHGQFVTLCITKFEDESETSKKTSRDGLEAKGRDINIPVSPTQTVIDTCSALNCMALWQFLVAH